MRRSDLRLLLAEARRLTNADEVLVIGSQSLLATWDESELPYELTMSREADMLIRVRNGVRLSPAQADTASRWLEHSGFGSEFDAQHGVHIDSISPGTATLPRGWEDRLVPIEATGPDGEPVRGMCLEPYDACASKLVANRTQDREFVRHMIEAGLVTPTLLMDRLMMLESDVEANHAFVFVQAFM